MVHVRNNPELALAFRSKELRKFFLEYLTELEEDPHVLKAFLVNGAENSFEKQMNQLSKSFQVIGKLRNVENEYTAVIRMIDGIVFSVGDMVVDEVQRKHNGIVKKYKISKMYEDDRGLHVRLNVDGEDVIMWRNLSQINHE